MTPRFLAWGRDSHHSLSGDASRSLQGCGQHSPRWACGTQGKSRGPAATEGGALAPARLLVSSLKPGTVGLAGAQGSQLRACTIRQSEDRVPLSLLGAAVWGQPGGSHTQ